MAKAIEEARAALNSYIPLVAGEEYQPLATQVTDLITDLLHLAVSEGGVSVDEVMRRALNYYSDDLN